MPSSFLRPCAPPPHRLQRSFSRFSSHFKTPLSPVLHPPPSFPRDIKDDGRDEEEEKRRHPAPIAPRAAGWGAYHLGPTKASTKSPAVRGLGAKGPQLGLVGLGNLLDLGGKSTAGAYKLPK